MFPGEKIQGTSSLSGVNFGATTLESLASNNVGGLKSMGLIQNTVVFALDLPNKFK